MLRGLFSPGFLRRPLLIRATFKGALRIAWRLKPEAGVKDLSGSFVVARDLIVRCDRRALEPCGTTTSLPRRVTGACNPGSVLGPRGMRTRLEGGVTDLPAGGVTILELGGTEDPPVRGVTLGAVCIWRRSWVCAKPPVALRPAVSSKNRSPKSIVRTRWKARICLGSPNLHKPTHPIARCSGDSPPLRQADPRAELFRAGKWLHLTKSLLI